MYTYIYIYELFIKKEEKKNFGLSSVFLLRMTSILLLNNLKAVQDSYNTYFQRKFSYKGLKMGLIN